MNNGLLSNFSKLVNTDQNEDNTNKPKVSYVYGKVTNVLNNGKAANVEIDGSTVSCPVKSNVTVEKGNRVMIMLRNHDATIVNNVSVPTITADYMKGEDGGKIIKDHMQESLDALKDYIDDIASAIGEKIFPIGSTYLTTTKTNPSTFLGGTWALVNEGYALMSVSANDAGGKYNGSSNSKSVSGIPAHSHTVSGGGTVSTSSDSVKLPNHTHSMDSAVTTNAFRIQGQDITYGYGLGIESGFADRVWVQMMGGHTDDNKIYFNHTNGVDGLVRHSIGYPKDILSPEHSHTVDLSDITIESSGSGASIDVTPKNFKVYVWYRTA